MSKWYTCTCMFTEGVGGHYIVRSPLGMLRRENTDVMYNAYLEMGVLARMLSIAVRGQR